MPHYRNGQKAKLGDVVKYDETHKTGDKTVTTSSIGVLKTITEGADTCNGYMHCVLTVTESGEERAVTPGSGDRYLTLKDSDKVA